MVPNDLPVTSNHENNIGGYDEYNHDCLPSRLCVAIDTAATQILLTSSTHSFKGRKGNKFEFYQSTSSRHDSNENPVLYDEEDSDMDEEFDDDNQGYVPLGQDDDDQDELLTETPQSENGEGGMTTCMNANGQSNDHSHLHEPMNPAHAALIVQSMSNISLPLSATPDWAKLVPEEMWKESLLTTIAERHNQDDM